MTDALYDLFIIGGGINGAGIARDVAGRGLSVMLAEQSDLGSATSSASTKLIHGGLRYLEHYEFKLVRHSLMEREVLWGIAPHIIWPLRFVLPHREGLRPAWMLRLGLFIYDNLGGRKKLPGTRTLRLASDPVGAPLHDVSAVGFEYSDCWVQDNRMVVLNVRDAAARGARIAARTRVTSARREGGLWRIELQDTVTGARAVVSARGLVNAAGPWVDKVIANTLGLSSKGSVRLVQGSHIIVPKLYSHDRCYIFQNPDGRIFFAIPYEEDFTLVGTTDRDYQGDPAKVKISEQELAYLCDAATSYFKKAVTPKDVVWAYSGVRPLYNDGASNAQETTRDYVLTVDAADGEAPLLNVFGGKITTYRCLAEDGLDKLRPYFPALATNRGWTGKAHLPGGDFETDGAAALEDELQRAHPFLTPRAARRLVRHYGTEARGILAGARTEADLGPRFGPDLTAAEVRHLVAEEYVRCAEDAAFRRTKAGIRMTKDELAALDAFIAAERGDVAVVPEETESA